MKASRWLTGAALGAIPIAATVHAIRQSQREPAVSARRFVSESLRAPGSTVVACLGASLVHGRIGASFVDELTRRMDADGYQLVNAGVNGDLAWNARQRIDDVVACDPDVVLVLVGSNDVMASMDASRTIGYRLFKRLPEKPSLTWFRKNLVEIAEALSTRTRARIGFCSLPTLGERIDSDVHARLQVYNAVIREVATQYGAAYVPVHETLDAWLEQTGHAGGPTFAAAFRRMLVAITQHYVFDESWDSIAQAHGYALFVDGIHVSERGARVIADEVERFLRDDVDVRRRHDARPAAKHG